VRNGIDILDMPLAQRIKPRSLKGMAACVLEWNVNMEQVGTAWNAKHITGGQIIHGASRPWLVVVLFKKFWSLKYDEKTASSRPENGVFYPPLANE
jgi:hypothetical protein